MADWLAGAVVGMRHRMVLCKLSNLEANTISLNAALRSRRQQQLLTFSLDAAFTTRLKPDPERNQVPSPLDSVPLTFIPAVELVLISTTAAKLFKS